MASSGASSMFVYVGNFAQTEEQVRANAEGIYIYRVDPFAAEWTPVQVVHGSPQPTFLVTDSQQRYLYAVNLANEVGSWQQGLVSAYAIDSSTGNLAFLNRQSTIGGGPCYGSFDHTGRYLMVANYVTGSLVMLPVDENGRLGEVVAFVQHEGSGPNPDRQEGPHAHSIITDPSNRFALAADLGVDKVFVYKLDLDNGKLVPNDVPYVSTKPGAGPRHLTFHPNGRYIYSANELDSTMTVFAWDGGAGSLREIQTVSTVPEDFKAINYPAHILFGPSGRYLYLSNREHDSIVIFAVDADTGKVNAVGWEPTRGEYPRHFTIEPRSGLMLVANQNGGNVVAFQIDESTGKLSFLGQKAEVVGAAFVQIVEKR